MPREKKTLRDPLDVALGARIRMRRKALGLSQQALGATVALTFQQVQKYELGTNRVSVATLIRLAGPLKCRPEDLIEGLGTTHDVVASPPALLAERGAMLLLHAYYEVRDPRARRAILGLTRALRTGGKGGSDEH